MTRGWAEQLPLADERPWNLIVVGHQGGELVRLTRVPRRVVEETLIGLLLDTPAGVGGGWTQQAWWPRVCVWSDASWLGG